MAAAQPFARLYHCLRWPGANSGRPRSSEDPTTVITRTYSEGRSYDARPVSHALRAAGGGHRQHRRRNALIPTAPANGKFIGYLTDNNANTNRFEITGGMTRRNSRSCASLSATAITPMRCFMSAMMPVIMRWTRRWIWKSPLIPTTAHRQVGDTTATIQVDDGNGGTTVVAVDDRFNGWTNLFKNGDTSDNSLKQIHPAFELLRPQWRRRC